MEKYWIILEPYTFIWSNDDFVLLYNTLSQEASIYKNTMLLNSLISELKDLKNLYSVLIDSQDLNDDVREFVRNLRLSFNGDIVSEKMCKTKPVVILPQLNINEDVERDVKSTQNKDVLGRKIVNNLISLDIYLGGECDKQCDFCKNKYKQHLWCNTSERLLEDDKFRKLFIELKSTNILSVNIIGNIFVYPYIEELISTINEFKFDIKIVIDCDVLLAYKDRVYELLNNKFKINILIGDESCLDKLSAMSFLQNDNIEYTFSVESEMSFSSYSKFIDDNDLKITTIYPYFNGTNNDFFEIYVFQNKDDILSAKMNRKDIFANQSINSNFFGKLSINSDGTIFSNINGSPIGSIDDGLKQSIYNEILEGTFWRKTRSSVTPCENCLFRDLCPPLSNYEIAMSKMNLCHINKE